MKKLLTLILLAIALVSCKGETPKSTSKKNAKDTIVQTGRKENLFRPIDTACSPKNKTDDYIVALRFYQSETERKAAENSPEQNDKLYDGYVKIREKYIACLNGSKELEKVLEKYAEYGEYDEKSGKTFYKLPENVKKLSVELEKGGLQFWDIGEGYTEIRSLPSHYYAIFKNKVTPDYEAFLYQFSKENEVSYQGDASLSISWEELGNRTIFWENFLEKYPKSPLCSDAENTYNNYLYDYLFGLDNTSTFNLVGETNYGLNEENKAEFRRFMQEYPKAYTTKKIKELIALFNAKLSFEEIREKINLKERDWDKYPTF